MVGDIPPPEVIITILTALKLPTEASAIARAHDPVVDCALPRAGAASVFIGGETTKRRRAPCRSGMTRARERAREIERPRGEAGARRAA